MFSKVPFLGALIQRNAAKKEVIEELRTNPFGGYGLYFLMIDANLLTADAVEELAPLIKNVEKRLDLSDEDLEIKLPLQIEPLTDEEFDTLTYVIGDALFQFGKTFHQLNERMRRAELAGIIDMLERHKEHTASIHFEIDLEHILVPILRHCGEQVRFEQLLGKAGGIYMIVKKSDLTSRYFPSDYLRERRLQRGEVVSVELIIKQQYLQIERFNRRCFYTKKWYLYTMAHKLPKDNTKAVVHSKEGDMYSLPIIYREPVADLIDLYVYHMKDKSYDTARYRPKYATGREGIE